MNLSRVVEPRHILEGAGSVRGAYVLSGSFGFVGGHEAMKFDAIVRA
jgi:hypothetical protein